MYMFSTPLRKLLPVAFALCTAGLGRAQVDFTFSLVGTPSHSTTTGTVTGELIGLQNNATSAPTDIIITSAPSQLHLPELSYDLAANGWTLNGTGDTFTVTNGEITSADYQANFGAQDFLDLNYSVEQNGIVLAQLNGLEYDGEYYTSNSGGFSGATYGAVSAPEPAPGALALAALGILVAGRWLRGVLTHRPSSPARSAACQDIPSRTS
jgi:hypothetical protein